MREIYHPSLEKKQKIAVKPPHLQYFNTYYKNYRNANTFLNYYATKTLKS